MSVSFRRGTEADGCAAAELWLRARKAAVAVIPRPVHGDDDVHAWFASHVASDSELWVAEKPAGALVGILVLDGPWVDQLYVEPAMTGRGIGAGLIELAKRERPDGLRLWTFAANTGAQRFYERHGFIETERTDGCGNEERAPDILYVWDGHTGERLPRMDVELRQITSDTVRAICELEVAADQRSFVAPNAVSIAEAHFTPGHWMRAIYADGQPVGFVLTFDDASEGYFLWRFMIAQSHQRRGIGRRAMQQVLEHWRELGATAARTSVVPSNTGATRLYESLGFRLTGEEDDGELVMSLDL
jgi:GNAT superfamily N-acetyltransferase